MSPFLTFLHGAHSAVRLRRRLYGPMRPSWTPIFETLAEVFHQGSKRVIDFPVAVQRRATGMLVTAIPDGRRPGAIRRERADGVGVRAQWFRHAEATPGAVLLYLHGGGYGLGSVRTHGDLIARLCLAGGCDALAVDYRLTPEHRFPCQLEDSTTAYRYLLSRGVEPQRIVIAGDSAGGGLTLSTLVALRDEGQPLPAAAVCLSPWVDLEGLGESMIENDRFDYISRRAIQQYARRFVDDGDIKNPLAAPLYADLTGLPPLLVQAGTAETLLDDARRVAARAREAGVDVELSLYDDMIHVFQLFAFVCPEAEQAIEDAGAFMRARLGTADTSVRVAS